MTDLFRNYVSNFTIGETNSRPTAGEPQQERPQETNRPQPQRGTIDSPFIALVHQARARERAERIAEERRRQREYKSLTNRTKRTIKRLFELD
jgi:hypothetical protein